jgi:hypothetical protein
MNIKPDKEIEKGDNIVNIGSRNSVDLGIRI